MKTVKKTHLKEIQFLVGWGVKISKQTHMGSPSKINWSVSKVERAYQKQPTVFQNKKRLPGSKKVSLKRYTRPVGLGFKMPNEVNVDSKRARFVALVRPRVLLPWYRELWLQWHWFQWQLPTVTFLVQKRTLIYPKPSNTVTICYSETFDNPHHSL